MVNLDATAGNRGMWPHKTPPDTVFMDKEINLFYPPDLQAVWSHLPFRDDVFDTVFFDPPHNTGKKNPFPGGPRSTHNLWFGFFSNRRHMVISLIRAQEEFQRVTSRLCFKWSTRVLKLHQALSCFKGWTPIHYYKTRPRNVRGVHHKSGSSWWVTLVKNPRF